MVLAAVAATTTAAEEMTNHVNLFSQGRNLPAHRPAVAAAMI